MMLRLPCRPLPTRGLPRAAAAPRRPRFTAVALALLMAAGSSWAAETAGAEPDEVTRELIDLLAASGALKPEDASRLVARLKARIEARRAAAPGAPAGPAAAATAAATPPAPLPSPAAPSGAPSSAPPVGSAASPGTAGDVRIRYLPESERQRIREDIKREVLAQARAENWAQPDALPEWTRRLRLDGDLRLRAEADLFDDSNAPFINFQAINAGAPFNVATGGGSPPFLNTTQDRYLPRLRLRLGLQADLADGWTAGVRLATGNTTNPVSTNQTLGSEFNKFSLTVDRAYLAFEPSKQLLAWGGRMPNPWQSTTLLWDEDLGFDGLALRLSNAGAGDPMPTLTAGAFSLYNTAFDAPSNGSVKQASRDRWLLGGQAAWQWRLDADSKLDVATAYYHTRKVLGRLSSPCLASASSDPCDSDITRPGFVQKGNTLFALRDLLVDGAQDNPPQYQYFGLASAFRILNLNARYQVQLDAGRQFAAGFDAVRNLGWKRRDVVRRGPVNNFDSGGGYDGGRNGLMVHLQYGMPSPAAAGQWNVGLNYRYLQSDAVMDAFTDSDFHLGGTNAKGYTLHGSIGLGRNTALQLRWLSATEVSGPPLAVDVIHVDLSAKF